MSEINQEEIKKAVIDCFKTGGVVINLPFDKINKFVEDAAKPVLELMSEQSEAILKKCTQAAQVTQTIKLVKQDKISTMDGLFHKDFSTIFNLVTARNPITGYPTGLWLHGNAGAGKTHLAEQHAEALGCPFWPIYGGPTMTETKLLGYRNAGSGTYVKGLTYDWYKEGGLLAVDEADLGESLSCMNSLFANRVYRFPDGEVIKRHNDTYLMALANTDGMGARQGYRRSVQDVAALDRFNFWKFEYDEKLEAALAGNFTDFADYVKKVRKWTQSQAKETNLHVTPRATMRGVALLACTEMKGIDVAEAAIFGRFPKDTKDACIKAVGVFDRKGESSFKMESLPAKSEPGSKLIPKKPVVKTSVF